MACHHYAFDPVVNVEEVEGVFHLAHNDRGEGIVVLRAIELEYKDRGDFWGRCGDVVNANLLEGGGRVRRGQAELGGLGSHDGHDLVIRERKEGKGSLLPLVHRTLDLFVM